MQNIWPTMRYCRSEVSCWRRCTACKHFCFYSTKKLISFQKNVSWKTIRLRVFSWEKFKNRETRGRIVSLDQLGGSKTIYRTRRHVYGLDESKHFKSLYTSVSKWAIICIWNSKSILRHLSSCERYEIITSKALGTMHAQHFLIAERAFSCEPTNCKSVHTWVTHLHMAVITITSSLRYA